MAVNVKALATNDLITGTTDAATDTLYTATEVRAQVAQCVAYNGHTASETVTVYILASGESASSNDPVAVKTVPNGVSLSIPEIIGLVVPDGGTLEAYAGTTDVIRLSVSGIEYS